MKRKYDIFGNNIFGLINVEQLRMFAFHDKVETDLIFQLQIFLKRMELSRAENYLIEFLLHQVSLRLFLSFDCRKRLIHTY